MSLIQTEHCQGDHTEQLVMGWECGTGVGIEVCYMHGFGGGTKGKGPPG